MLSHAPAWVTNMSPILVYFKAHPRGFEWGAINGTSGDIIGSFRRGERERYAWRHLRALGEESLGFEDGLQAAARDRGDDGSHHSSLVFSSFFFVFPCFSF